MGTLQHVGHLYASDQAKTIGVYLGVRYDHQQEVQQSFSRSGKITAS